VLFEPSANGSFARLISMRESHLVAGAGSSGKASWDCTSPNWEEPWTSQLEIYCQDDFDAVIDAIQPSAIVSDPATVAKAWGRVP
jgi:hypothetical protein